MSSVGQAAGMIVGGAIGIAFPAVGFALGASIGGAIGGMIDPPKGPNTVGPRLDDLSYQSAAFGVPLAHAYGTVPVLGNVFWLEGDKYKEVGKKTKNRSGGKGGGSKSTTTTFTYYATCAISLFVVRDPAQTIKLRRLWVGSNLVYDASGAVLSSTIASHLGSVNFTFYDGSDPQAPHPRMQADKGAANVSGYPGFCYIVIEDLDLTPYSNSLEMAQVKAEVTVGGATMQHDLLAPVYDSADYGLEVRRINGVRFTQTTVDYDIVSINTSSLNMPYALKSYRETVGEGRAEVSTTAITDNWGAPYTWTTPALIQCMFSDAPMALFVQERQGSPTSRLRRINTGGIDEYSGGYSTTVLPYTASLRCVADGGQMFLFTDGTGMAIRKVVWPEIVLTGSTSYIIRHAGLSESYLFAVAYNANPSQTTVYKFSREDLSLVDTFVQSVADGTAGIYVVSDDLFYTAANGHIYRWDSGVVTDDLGVCTSYDYNTADGLRIDFYVDDDNPPFGYFIDGSAISTIQREIRVFHQVVPAATAKLRDIVTDECGYASIAAASLDLSSLTNSDVRGFRAAQGSARAALEQLQAIFPFDVTISGYKLKFVSRGGASVATIDEGDLGARQSGESLPVLLPIAREMDSQIPATVKVKHLDPDREYDIGEQFAIRPGTASVGERTVETSVVLNTTEAARAADVLNQKDWTERRDYGPFALPPTFGHLEPADVVTVQHRGTSHNLRLTQVEYLQDGRISCSARMTAAQSYVSTATGVPPLVLGQSTVPLRGSTVAMLLDIPRMDVSQDVPGMCFGLYGKASGWPGGSIFRSADYGNTWNGVASTQALLDVFTASDALSSHSGHGIDAFSLLTVVPETPGADLFSVTEDQLYTYANIAAYGLDGRWEIVSFRTVVDNTGSYTLSGFLRGLYGTEWASGLHVVGDLLVMLTTDAVGFFGLPIDAKGVPNEYRAVTSGAALESATELEDTYDAINLLPLSPVDCNGSRNPSSYDWTITADRRTRQPVPLFSGAAVPLGETSEGYDLELWDSGFTSKIRTFSGLPSPSATWTGAMQTTDTGGVNTPNVYFRWYQVSPQVGRGLPYQGSLYRPMKVSGAGYSAAVLALSPVLYLKMDGNTTTITDSSPSGNNGTASATNVTYQEPSLFSGETPGYSIKFTTGYVTVPHNANLNSGHTVCFLMKPNSMPASETVFIHKGDAAVGGSQGYHYSILPDGKLGVIWYNDSWRYAATTNPYFSALTKVYVTLRCNGSNAVSVFANGAFVENIALAAAFVNNGYPLTINGGRSTSYYGLSVTNTLDEFAWFNTQLTDAQIAALYEET